MPTAPDEAMRPPRLLLCLAAAAFAATLLILILLPLRLLPTGIAGQWNWPWREPNFAPNPLLVLVLVLYGGLLAGLLRLLAQPTLRRRQVAALLVGACLTIAGTLLLLESNELAPALHLSAATASASATGYLSYSTLIEGVPKLLQGLSGDPSLVIAMPARVQTHPPGPVLYYYLGGQVLDRWPALTEGTERYLATNYGLTPALLHRYARGYAISTVTPHDMVPGLLLGMLLTLSACLLPLPAYFAGRALGTRREGLIAAFCATLIPSLLVFIPSIDGWGAVLALATVAAGLWALRQQSMVLYALTGLLMAAAGFWSLGLLAMAVCLGGAAVPQVRGMETRRRTLTGMSVAVAAFVLPYGLLALGGYSLPGNIMLMRQAQANQMILANRDYGSWIGMNLYDFALFGGPLLLALALGAFSLWSKLQPGQRAYLCAAWLALALVWLSGSTLAEVGRIWLFLMPPLAVAAALPLSALPAKAHRPLLALLTLLQVALVIGLHSNLALVQP